MPTASTSSPRATSSDGASSASERSSPSWCSSASGLRPRLARLALGATGAFFALALLVWVRGGFGMAFVGALAAACLAIALLASPELARLVLVFLATQLALSVFSRGDYLFEDYVSGQMSGGGSTPADVKIMELAVGMPYWFWGIVCGAFSIAVLGVAAWLYLRPASGRRG